MLFITLAWFGTLPAPIFCAPVRNQNASVTSTGVLNTTMIPASVGVRPFSNDSIPSPASNSTFAEILAKELEPVPKEASEPHPNYGISRNFWGRDRSASNQTGHVDDTDGGAKSQRRSTAPEEECIGLGELFQAYNGTADSQDLRSWVEGLRARVIKQEKTAAVIVEGGYTGTPPSGLINDTLTSVQGVPFPVVIPLQPYKSPDSHDFKRHVEEKLETIYLQTKRNSDQHVDGGSTKTSSSGITNDTLTSLNNGPLPLVVPIYPFKVGESHESEEHVEEELETSHSQTNGTSDQHQEATAGKPIAGSLSRRFSGASSATEDAETWRTSYTHFLRHRNANTSESRDVTDIISQRKDDRVYPRGIPSDSQPLPQVPKIETALCTNPVSRPLPELDGPDAVCTRPVSVPRPDIDDIPHLDTSDSGTQKRMVESAVPADFRT